MEKIDTENVFNQRKIATHIVVLLLSLVMICIVMFINSGFKQWYNYIDGFILSVIQLEFFLFLAYIIFKNVRPGKTRKEFTKIILLRFLLFLFYSCISAFIIFIVFLFIVQLLIGGAPVKEVSNFLSYGFGYWFKTIIAGQLFGAFLFSVILWQDALKREQKLREQNLIFQNETLKNQVNPHFLFNSLNTISALIATQPDVAEMFINKLSSIYRYVLENNQKDKVPLLTELAFINDYFGLHIIRDEDKIQLVINTPKAENFKILPVSLQIILENAIKHNMATRQNPLRISIFIEDKHVIVKNNLQKMAVQLKSTKIGLKNLAERVRLITGKMLIIEETNTEFIVKVPLLS